MVSVLLAETIAQVLKRLASQARPLAVMPGLDTHGYPQDPAGNAYPSAHTALVVALACALWPWLRPSQRVVAVVLMVLIPLNRVYIGAHWPMDLVGGAAVGLLVASITWLIAVRWPVTLKTRPGDTNAAGGTLEPRRASPSVADDHPQSAPETEPIARDEPEP